MRRAALLCLAVLLPLPAAASEVGARDYAAHCAVCHGTDAKGRGPYHMFLTVAPADLTRLSERNGGRFPVEAVMKIVDGRTELLAHGPREMPIWGYEFRRLAARDTSANPEREAQARILAIIDHLRGLQTP